MNKLFDCPHCKKKTVSLAHKYAAGYWRWIACDNCHMQLSAHPVALALLQMLYIWVIMIFGFLTLNIHWTYALWGVICWLIMDSLNVWLIPLTYRKAALK